MSFPVRSNLFKDDSYFCDWRVWVDGCEGETFFRTAVSVNASIHFFCMVGFAGLVLYRVGSNSPFLTFWLCIKLILEFL